ncbi:hypothetical protein ASC95_28055 [Pelomonas sp. Root1217]|uniref:PDZ domain-containing protein n=1 Tax=Pelomonas sp. Root1217 TaxID=1736430 RepID=UPI00070AB61E|nr:PDZ domain-containing protein [Pelomonas sp. Root1217]KQV59573.1 hypothetical protein ASC95_28055 [Pelomonas sp. Root1217]
MKIHFQTLLVTLAVLAGGAQAETQTLTVKDAKSLEAALHWARTDKRIRHIELASGNYQLAAPLVIDEALSGSAEEPFVLAAAPGARAVLSGATSLPALRWEAWKDGIWRARYAGRSFQRLWLGQAMLVRARYPNFDPANQGFGGAPDATSPERVARWHDPQGAVLHALHGARWGGVQVPILGKKADGSLLYGEQVDNNRVMPPSDRDRFVENVLEELDAPSEWFHDRKEGWLYVKPSANAQPPARGFRGSAHEALIRIEGRAEVVQHVRVQRLVFRETEPTYLKATEPLLRSDWKFYRVGAVTIENAGDIRIEDSDFADLGGHGVVVSGRAEQVAISGNHIHDIGGTAIAFVGRPEAVRSPLFEYYQRLELAAIDRTPGPKSDVYPKDSQASDNLIHDIGQIDRQATGVQLSMAARITVDHNSIYRMPRAGINIGDGTWGGHRITHNDVFDTVRMTGDHGSFNSWGRDRFWHPDRAEMDRRAASHPELALLDAVEPIVMKRNRWRCDHGWDVDLDDGASNYVIEENLMLAGGLKLREGFQRVVRNNILVNGSFHPHVWFDNGGDVFESNVVMGAHQPVEIKRWGRSVNRNFFVTEADLRDAQARGTDADSVAGDPRFAAPAKGDYTVTSEALAARIGFVNFPMDDFGVRPARLKALALHPVFPVPQQLSQTAPRAAQQLHGLSLKPVETLGEQSAAGLGDKAGLIVLSVDAGSPGAAAGLQPRDVIVGAGLQAINDVATLQALLATGRSVDLIVVRNQARTSLQWPRAAASSANPTNP